MRQKVNGKEASSSKKSCQNSVLMLFSLSLEIFWLLKTMAFALGKSSKKDRKAASENVFSWFEYFQVQIAFYLIDATVIITHLHLIHFMFFGVIPLYCHCFDT